MFRILRVIIQGFRSFKDKQTFQCRGPGFYVLSGENKVTPDLEANGAGKSTIWEAIVWCIYGKTSRGQKAGDIANWDREDSTFVELHFEVDGVEYALLRTWDEGYPNTLTLTEGRLLEPRTLEQDEVEALVGADYTTFLHTVLMSQFGHYFFDLSPTDALKVFSDLLGLGRWEQAAARAKSNADAREEEARSLTQESVRASGAVTALEAECSALTASSEEFEARHQDDIKVLEQEMDRAQERLSVAEAEVKRLEAIKRAHEESLAGAKKRLIAIDNELNETYQPAVRDCTRDLKRFKDDLKARQEKYDAMERLGEGVCPTCMQDVDRKHLQGVLAELKKDVEHAEVNVTTVTRKHRLAADVLQEKLDRRRGLEDDYERAESAVDASGRLVSTARSQSSRARAEVEAAAKNLGRARGQTNPHTARFLVAQEQLTKEKHQQRWSKKEAARSKIQADRFRFWVRGFKDLRLWIVQQVLTEYEVATNNALPDLGLDGWKVRYEIERETKGGTVTKGFSIFVKPPGETPEVPWKSWSGGETQRLRIAGAMGLADVATNHRGFTTTIEAWDEPTAHMGPGGINDLLQVFKQRSRRDGLEIWLIDHHALDAGEFDGSAWVTKTPRGSRIAQS